jgi:ribosomal protein S18 acetylase RimI-like enzyme
MTKETAGSGDDTQILAGLTLRPEREDDLEFLYNLYASTRADEMALTDWADAEKKAFLRMQFDAQRAHYLAHYRTARFDVIEQAGVAIGRLYVVRWPDDIRIIDIALLPEHRRQGAGGGLLHALLDEAAATERSVSIHVEVFNPAMTLYQRLGFEPTGEETGVYRLMEWRART